MIRTVIDKEQQLTMHICIGKVTLDAVLKEITDFYDGDPTPHNVWDFSEADLSEINTDQIRGVAEFAKRSDPERKGGRTALVSGLNHNYAYSRMYETFAEMSGVSAETQVFRSMEDALTWIQCYEADR